MAKHRGTTRTARAHGPMSAKGHRLGRMFPGKSSREGAQGPQFKQIRKHKGKR